MLIFPKLGGHTPPYVITYACSHAQLVHSYLTSNIVMDMHFNETHIRINYHLRMGGTSLLLILLLSLHNNVMCV